MSAGFCADAIGAEDLDHVAAYVEPANGDLDLLLIGVFLIAWIGEFTDVSEFVRLM